MRIELNLDEVKPLTSGAIMRMSDKEAEAVFMKIRWSETTGVPVCPRCESVATYRYHTRRLLHRCKACDYQFTPVAGTIFSSGKMPYRYYLLAIVCAMSDGN